MKPARKHRLIGLVMWAVIIASFTLSAQTWIEIARLAGFTQITHPFGGRNAAETARHAWHLAWCMPVVVDGYVMVALLLWMSDVNERLAAFARKNTYAAAGFGVLAQSAFHAFTISMVPKHELWQIYLAAIVGAIPPGFSAMAVHMRVMVARYAGASGTPASTPASTPDAASTPVPASTGTPVPGTPETVPEYTPSTPVPVPVPVASTPVPVPETASTPVPRYVPSTPASTPVLDRVRRVHLPSPAKSTAVPEVRPGMSNAEILADLYLIGGLPIRQIKSRYGIGQPRAEVVRAEYADGVPVPGVHPASTPAINGHKILNGVEH